MNRYVSALLLAVLISAPRVLQAQEQPDLAGEPVSGSCRALLDLLKNGDQERLGQACAERGLDPAGNVNELSRRLIEYRLQQILERTVETAAAVETTAPGQDGGGIEPPGVDQEEPTAPGNEAGPEAGPVGGRIILENADIVRYLKEHGQELVILEGEVSLAYGTNRIQADRMVVNLYLGSVTGSGSVRFFEGNSIFTGDRFAYNLRQDRGFFMEAETAIGEFLYTGETIRKLTTGAKYLARDVMLSTCNIEYPHYRIEADALYYYDEDRVLIKGASLYFGQSDVIRLPFLYRNLRERRLRTAFLYRNRSGLIMQNTYNAVSTDALHLVLMGDFYERLGVYGGAELGAEYERGETDMEVSAALSNDVYFYEQLGDRWSQWSPPSASVYGIDRSIRYRGALYQEYVVPGRLTDTTEVNLQYISDPYYRYDFERRTTGFDLFDLIALQESDFPRKDEGYSLYARNELAGERFTASMLGSLRMEPQRNPDQDLFSLPDYYVYRPYILTAPYASALYTDTLFPGDGVFSNLDFTGAGRYSNVVYYDQGEVSDKVHSGRAAVSATREYLLGRAVSFTPDVELGAQARSHVEPTGDQLTDDRQSSYVYGRTTDELQLGPDTSYLALNYDLKYKLFGPEDDYLYNRFRIHDLGVAGYLDLGGVLVEQAVTSYDLRPVYDWAIGEYRPVGFTRERFEPLRNTLLLTPSEGFQVTDVFVYDIAGGEPSTNRFGLSSSSRELDVGGNLFTLSWDLDWYHYFTNPVLDMLDSIFRVDVAFRRYMSGYFLVLSRNENLWKYFSGPAGDRGIAVVNPLTDLLKSVNFFNREDREESNFKLKAISLGLVRSLHDWELKVDYTGNRELSYDGTRYVWDNIFSISIGLKDVEGVTVHGTFTDER